MPEGVSTPSVLATYVNITNNIENERKTNRGEESKQKKTNKAKMSKHDIFWQNSYRIVCRKSSNFDND